MTGQVCSRILDGKYQIQLCLGAGGFGTVFLARDTLLNHEVAIKVLHDQNPHRHTQLIEEMRYLHQIRHANVVAFYHHFTEGGLLHLVMEYCSGGSLRDRIRDKALSAAEAVRIVADLASTMEFIHGRGVVHHDIKPENLLLSPDGTLKIGDFGVANQLAGTIPYVAPECWSPYVDAQDIRLDVYACGITLIELLTGGNPFAALSTSEILPAKRKHDFVPAHLDRWLQEVIARATHPTPELRFQNMAEFREALDAKRVHYVFDRTRVQAQSLANKAEKLLARHRLSSARKCILQALQVRPDCLGALVAAGRHALLVNDIAEARKYFDQALAANPRTHVQKELGWIRLSEGRYPQAISMLTDHLDRNADDYEAYNLLLECFYLTDRFGAGMEIAEMMNQQRTPSECFANNGLVCALREGGTERGTADWVTAARGSEFVTHNLAVATQSPDRLEHSLLFQEYRFGLQQIRSNRMTIEIKGRTGEFGGHIVSIGRDKANDVVIDDSLMSRHHCVLVNYRDDVWVYDTGSAHGVYLDGNRIARKAYLSGIHTVQLGRTELTVRSSLERLL